MNLFLDTNVIIGFIFSLNSLHKLSKKIFSKTHHTYFYSNTVKDEVDLVFDRKKEEYKTFLRTINHHLEKLKNTRIISIFEMHKIIDKINKIGKFSNEDMHSTFNKMWKYFDFAENQEISTIIVFIEKLIEELKSLHDNRKNYLLESIKEIPNHSSKNQKVLRMIEKENLREHLDEKDEKILFDLNEYASKYPQLDLCLVSWDDGFIKAVKILLDRLSFKKYIGRDEI
ncbi:MAG: hypothetical protein IJP12_02405 [Methanobrevibacter sp.]|nr:hypothetical protein [Methanobrevibacter sp.]